MDRPTIEQMARDLLTRAVKDRLLTLDYRQWSDPNPEKRSGPELQGVKNLLAKFLSDAVEMGLQNAEWLKQAKTEMPLIEQILKHLTEAPSTRHTHNPAQPESSA
jgi:hypothetical protein